MRQIGKPVSRVGWLMIIMFLVMIIFIARLFYLQVIKHSYYKLMANQEQRKQLVIPAQRGEIYALDGNMPVKLVLNQTVYTVFADPMLVDEPEKVVKSVEEIAGGNARSNLLKLFGNKELRYQVLATNVTKEQAEKLKDRALKGVGFKKETRRVYPEGALAAQTLGFVDRDGVGKYGFEGGENERLSGKDGLLRSVTDISNVPLTIGPDNVNIPPKDGENLVLTIDRNVQFFTEAALKRGLDKFNAPKGSAIVMNPKNGHIMAMANIPTFNPGEYGKVDDLAVFNNPIIHDPYEPGSDIKTLTMAIGIDTGTVSPDSTYVNTDQIKVGDRTIFNATRGQVGEISFQHALNYSLNTGFVTLAQRLGDGKSINLKARNTMYDYFFNRFKLGQLTKVELAGEVGGTIVPPNDPNGVEVRYSNMAFGQGMDITMIQTAAAFSAIINDGKYHQPVILAGSVDDAGRFIRSTPASDPTQIVSNSTASTMRDMIIKARRAFFSRGDKPGYNIGGKTGTSQAIKDGKYVFNETVGTYLGFGGSDSPEYVIMVQVSGNDRAFDGGSHALPIFTDISNLMIDYLQLQPKG